MTRIPKVLHYTFGMAPDFGGKPWSLVHHVCLASAVERIKPDRVMFYYEFEPTGPWWALSRELVTLVKVEAPREIFGRPVLHVAHRSDVLRLQKLIEHGGIYLDADVLVQRNFDDLLDHSTVLGTEGKDGEFGLANAVILAEPGAPFLRRWYAAYRTFRSTGRDEFWSEHSVRLPAKLAREYPDEITVLQERAFFWPTWTPEHLELIFESRQPLSLHDTYANHLWEAQAWPYLEDLTPRRVRRHDTNFNRWARPFLAGLSNGYGAPSISRRVQKLKRRSFKRAGAIAHGIRSRFDYHVPRLGRSLRRLLASDKSRRQQTFQDVYKRNLWGAESGSTFFSGVGSRGEAVERYVEQMGEILRRHAAELNRPLRIVDLGCGDFAVGRALLAGLTNYTYVGCDIVPELIRRNTVEFGSETIRFQQLDIVTDPVPDGDVCLVRQVLQHLSNTEVNRAIKQLRHEHVYVTEGHPAERVGPLNPDKVTGADVRYDWRIGRGRGVELSEPPFNVQTEELFRSFAPPHEIIITERVIRRFAERPDGRCENEADSVSAR